jgi:hypothetical protein
VQPAVRCVWHDVLEKVTFPWECTETLRLGRARYARLRNHLPPLFPMLGPPHSPHAPSLKLPRRQIENSQEHDIAQCNSALVPELYLSVSCGCLLRLVSILCGLYIGGTVVRTVDVVRARQSCTSGNMEQAGPSAPSINPIDASTISESGRAIHAGSIEPTPNM